MKRAAILFFLIQSFLYSFSQVKYHPLVEANKLWYEEWSGHPSSLSNVFKCEGDTVINNKNYKFVYISVQDYPFGWWKYGYIREDAHRVYFSLIKHNDPGYFSERLVYDFGAQMDDELTVHTFGLFMEPISLNITITGIDSVMVDGDYRKRTKFNRSFYFYSYWIEGIGSISGFLNPGGDFIFACPAPWLSCVKVDGETIYPDGYSGSCWIVGTPENMETQHHFKIYPNPAQDYIIITPITNSNQKHKLVLYSATGKVVDVIEIDQFQESYYSFPDLSEGIFFYRINDDQSVVQSGKILIQ